MALTLGEFISLLEVQDQEKCIKYDFVHFDPGEFDSWRGDYGYLALGYDNGEGEGKVVKDILEMAKDAVGRVYNGWKGGEYRMTKETPLRCANPGESGDTAIVGVQDKGWVVVIMTQWEEYQC